ncbi:MAG: hypothetical protein PHG66_06180 [Candidatus Colwellbacteria bacterium]|nr:hypothetical protein [Candidatus Colwellbacteria bacterium]
MEPKKDRLQELASNVEADYSIWKVISVIAFTAASAAAFGIFLSLGIPGGTAGTALLFLSCLVMQALLIKSSSISMAGAAIESAAMVIPVFLLKPGFPLLPLAFAVALSFLFMVWATLSARDTLDNELKIRFSKVAGAVLPKSFTAIAIFLAMIFGFSFRSDTLFSPGFIGPLVDLATPVIGYFVPNFSSDMTTRDFLAVSASSALAKNGVIDFNLMPDSLRDQIINESVEGSKKALENGFGITISLDVSFKDSVRLALSEKLKDVVSKMPPYIISVMVALIVFSLVKALGLFVHWLVTFFAFVIYQILLATGFAETILEPRSREIVVMK